MQSATQMVIREQRAKARLCPALPLLGLSFSRHRGGRGGAGQTGTLTGLRKPQVPSGVSYLPEADAGYACFHDNS